jgi:uncharacterized RDD family membrane protein YckC
MYAGLFRRIVAFVIDLLIIVAIYAIFYLAFGNNSDTSSVGIFRSILSAIIILVLVWLYFALMERSSHQGTLGKMALSIKITDLEGNGVSFIRASVREFVKSMLLLGICLLGATIQYSLNGYSDDKSTFWALLCVFLWLLSCAMIMLSPKKQGLHDMLAKTVVVRKK